MKNYSEIFFFSKIISRCKQRIFFWQNRCLNACCRPPEYFIAAQNISRRMFGNLLERRRGAQKVITAINAGSFLSCQKKKISQLADKSHLWMDRNGDVSSLIKSVSLYSMPSSFAIFCLSSSSALSSSRCKLQEDLRLYHCNTMFYLYYTQLFFSFFILSHVSKQMCKEVRASETQNPFHILLKLEFLAIFFLFF